MIALCKYLLRQSWSSIPVSVPFILSLCLEALDVYGVHVSEIQLLIEYLEHSRVALMSL